MTKKGVEKSGLDLTIMSFFPYNLWYIGSCIRVFSIKEIKLGGCWCPQLKMKVA